MPFDTAALSQWFAANRTEVVLVGGAGVAGLALLRKKKSAGGAAVRAGVTSGAAAPGTMPAAAVVPAGGGGYSSDAFSAYNALQDEIGTLARQSEAARQTSAAGSGVSSGVRAPVASNLLAPTYSGNYWHMGSGIGETESDGSFLVLTPDQWKRASAGGADSYSFTDLGSSNVPGVGVYATSSNLVAKNKALTAAQAAQTSGA